MQTIYCDESGFSGNNLSEKEQPFFVYASIAVDPTEAEEVVTQAVRDFRLDAAELKGQRLLRHERGCSAISWILERCAPNARVSVWHKKYALACKFFEYIFEPPIAEKSSIFYGIGFHRFISNLLYMEVATQDKAAEDLLSEFQALMREKRVERLPIIFGDRAAIREHEVLNDIARFAAGHQTVIEEELSGLEGNDAVGKWILDLTTSALFALLAYWGERFEQLDVYCDESKPLRAHDQLFNVMVGRQDRIHQQFEGRRQAITFNLARPITLVRSEDHPGVQIADVFARAVSFGAQNPEDSKAKHWLQTTFSCIDDSSVFPDAERVDLREREPFIHAMVLHELVQRTETGKSLFDGIPERIRAFNSMYDRRVLGGEELPF